MRQLPVIQLVMSEIDPAIERLDAALQRLEGAIDTLLSRAGEPEVVKAELAALQADRERLAGELDEALAREHALQGLADEASAALGSAINEVRAALDPDEE